MAKAPKHPAKKFWMMATVLLLLACVFGFIALFLAQWSRTDTPAFIWDVDGSLRFSDGGTSKIYVGLWANCIKQGAHLDAVLCFNSDLDSVPAFGNDACKSYIVATRATMSIGVAFAFLALLACAAVGPKVGNKKATGLGICAMFLCLVTFAMLLTAWLCWIGFAESVCQGDGRAPPYSNPIQGYSTSFILACFASGFALFALLATCLGLKALKSKTPPKVAASEHALPIVMPPPAPKSAVMEEEQPTDDRDVQYPEITVPVSAPPMSAPHYQSYGQQDILALPYPVETQSYSAPPPPIIGPYSYAPPPQVGYTSIQPMYSSSLGPPHYEFGATHQQFPTNSYSKLPSTSYYN